MSGCERSEAQPNPSGPSAVVRPSISGFVHERAPIADVPIGNVVVELVNGTSEGKSTTTDSGGRFTFDDPGPGELTLRFTKEGYEERREIVAPVPIQSNRTVDVDLSALPPVAHLSVRIGASGMTSAILGYSPIHFDASASRAVLPTFRIEFGDGTVSAEPTTVHRCTRWGLHRSRLTVTDAFGRTATAAAEFQCLGILHQQGRTYSLTYGWLNFDYRSPRDVYPRRISFGSHVGAELTGRYSDSTGRYATLTARLHGDRNIRIVLDDRSVEFDGEILLDDRSHEFGYTVKRHLDLIAKGGRDDGRRLTFAFYDPF